VTDSVHDMGGMDGFGKVEPEPDEPVFHEKWKAACSRCSAPWATPAPGTSTRCRAPRKSDAPMVYRPRITALAACHGAQCGDLRDRERR
jgi:hypothetical protein